MPPYHLRSPFAESLKKFSGQRAILTALILTLAASAALGVTSLYASSESSRSLHAQSAERTAKTNFRQPHSATHSITAKKAVVDSVINDVAPVTVSAASYESPAVAPEALVAAFGTKLATVTALASDADPAMPGYQLPTTLGGTTVRVNGNLAGLLFVSPLQVNYVMPANTQTGTAIVQIVSGDGTISNGIVKVTQAAPSVFGGNADGRGVPAGYLVRVKADGAQTFESVGQLNPATGRLATRPIDLGPAGERVFLVIFLSGIAHAGDTNNDNNLNESVHVIIGGTEIVPTYAGQQGVFAGLEQLNVELPRSLIGRGKVNFSVIASGYSSSNLNEIEFAGVPGVAPPQVAGFSAANVLAGQMMTISGAGFAASATDNLVRIGGAEARVTAATTNELSVFVPFGAETGKVSVRTPLGEGESSAALALRTSISGFIEDTARQPMRNVRVKVLGRDIEVTTNREGLFLLPDVPTGAALVEVDANAVTSPPFPKVTLKMSVSGNRDNQFARPISLQQATGPSLGIGGGATEPQAGTTQARRYRTTQAAAGGTIQTGGVTLEVPSGDGMKSSTITLTLLDNSRTPIDLPPGQFSSAIAQITPFGVTLDPGGKLTFPNPQNFAPGSMATLFRFEQNPGSPDIGRFVEAGNARVSDDGQRIETEAGAISRGGIYFVSNLRQTTTVVGRVVDSDGATPVRNALVRARGQEAFTDGDGAFILRNVAVSPGEQISVEASFKRAETRVDRKQSNAAPVVIGGLTFITPDIVLPAPAINRPPVIQAPATLTISEGAITDIPITVTDPDEDQTVSLALSGAGFAALIESAGTVLRLSPGFSDAGSYTLTLTATDNLNLTATRNITLTISNTNRAPSATAQSLTLNEDNSQAITLTGSDPDGDTITFAIVAPPARGALTGTAPNLTYTPAANYNGADSFTFKVSDGTVDSAPVTVNFTINAVNDAPTASAQTITTPEDTARSITLAGSDIDGDTLSFTVVSAPANGALSGTAPNLTYTPAADYNGPDSFTFKVNDGTVDSTTATVSISVTAVNDAPVAADQSATTNEDTARAITLAGSDVDGDPLSYAIVSGPANGALSGTAPNLTYTPAANYNGADSFTFRVSDGSLSSAPATVTLTITSINDLPTITAGGAISVTQSQSVTSAAVATVSDIETPAAALTVTAQTVPTGLTISNLINTNGAITADIAAACNAAAGANTVVLRVTDAGGATSTANLTVNVTAAALNITMQPSSQSALNGASATFSVTATGTGTLAYQWRRGGANLSDGGNVSGATSATLTINPVSPGDAGSYDVVVTGACGSVTSNAVTLNALNNAPVLRLASLNFDGNPDSTGDYVTVDDASALDLSDNFTVEAWIRPNTGGASGCCRTIISKPARDDGTQATGFRLDLSNDQPSFGIVDPGGPKTVTASTPVSPGVWTHLAAVKQGSMLKLYLNGLLAQSANTGSTSGARTDADFSQSTKLIIGREFLTGLLDRTFAGTISDVRLWNVVRTDTEILNNFDALLTGSETGLVLNLRLNEGSGTVANDRSSAGRQGTLGGGVTVNQPTWQAVESYTENSPPLTLFNNLTVSDQENANLTSATVRFTSGFISSEDALNFTNQGGITGSFNSVSGTLTLTGSAAVSAYEAALRSISYSNSSENPNTTDRTLEVKVNDGQADSNPAVLTLSVIAINDAPTITAGAAISVTQSQSVTGAAIATVSDIETTAAALTVTPQTVPTGLTISNLINTNGAITADIAAACNAAAGANTVVLRVTDAGGATSTANLTVNVTAASLNISSHPAAQTICENSAATFSVTASGTGTLSYQWRKDGAIISGATSSSFTIASATTSDTGSYEVVITGACSVATSNAATLTVNTTVGISNQPIAQTVCEGAAASFSVIASGTGPFTYQWRKNGSDISGATSSAFSPASTTTGDAGSYDVIVTGACGTITSNAATLAFHAAPSLGTYPTTSVAAGGNVTATPSSAPVSSATITSLTAVAPAGFAGTLAVNTATGVVTITNAAPAGSYIIVVTAINSCGLSSTRNFTLTVNDPTACATPGFAAPASLSAGTQPRFITTGDFNGDGKQDFVVANFGSNNATILLGNGGGGFTQAPGSPFAVGAGPVGVAVADYNGDGKQDLATANYTADNVTVLLGDGSGGFTEAAGSPFSAVTGIHPESIVAGDFNSDGKFDLAVANVFSDNVTILLGNGSGGFTQAAGSPISVGAGPYTLVLGDFNSDGAQDIISANYISHTLTILSGDGSGGFSVTTGPTIGSGLTAYYYVAVGEFNSDGHQDLAITNYDTNDVTIRLGNGSGGFLPAELPSVRVGAAPYSVVTGDFNGDGKQDLAIANLSSDNVTILLGDGSAGFSPATGSPLSVGSAPHSVTVGDFNGDGKQEIATANFASNTISTRLAYCNQIPSITAGSALTLSQPQTITGTTIATVSDTETAAGNLTVTATAPAGITVSNIVNTGGAITADVATDCAAFSGANTVVLRVTDEGGQSATANLIVNVNGNITINEPPGPDSALIGAEISFTVSATGPGTLAYQWRKNGVNLTEDSRVIGTTTATLTLSPVASGDDGDYDVVITSACGSVISSAATLTIINEAPALNVPRNLFGVTGSLISFTASATDTDVNQTLTFSATNLPTGANFDPGTREFTWTPEFDQVGVFNVNITVTDNGVPVLSDTKTVTITTTPLLNWAQTSGPAGGPVFPLVIDGSSIFVGTPEGISRSGDDGATWSGDNGDLPLSPVTGFAKIGATRFVLQYDSAGHYVYRSADGVTWTNVSSGLPTTLPFTAIQANGTALFVATLGGGVYRSTDNGDTWIAASNGLPNLNALALAADGIYLYAGLDDAIAVSADDGDNWAAVNTGLPLGAPPLAVRSFATNGAKIYAGTNKGVFESTLGGTSWTGANSGLFEVDIQTLTLDGATLYAGIGNFNGVWRADTSGVLSWTQDANGLDVQTINSIAITATKRLISTPRGVFASAATQGSVWNFSGSGLIFTDVTAFTQIFPIKYAATNGNGVFRTSDNGGAWTAVNNGLNDPAVFSLATDGTILFAGTSAGVYSSSDNGANWTFFDNLSTLPLAGRVNGMTTLGSNIFAGTQTGGVYRSDKTTAAWIQVNNGLTNLSVRALAKFGTKLYAGTDNGLFRSTDNGDNWTLISGAGSGLTNQAIRAFTGFSGSMFVGTAGGVFYSTDDGDTWTAVNTGLTNLNIQSLAYNLPNFGIHVFAGTDNGVFFTDDGINWKNAGYGLRNRNVRSLFFDSIIFGGTSGGGVYTSPVPSGTPSAAEPNR